MLLGNGDGTFQPRSTYAVGGWTQMRIVAGDFTATASSTWPSPTALDDTVSVLLGNGDGTFQPQVTYAVGDGPVRHRGGRLQRRRPPRPGRSPTTSPTTSRCCWATATARSQTQASSPPPLMPRPWWPTSTATAPTMSWSSMGPATSSIARASPASPAPSSRPSRSTPCQTARIPHSRDIAWVPNTVDGPLLASVDAQDDAVSLYAYRDGGFVRVGSLTTGQLPAQIIAADLNGDGWDDLVVRNAGDGTLSVYFRNNAHWSASIRRRSTSTFLGRR